MASSPYLKPNRLNDVLAAIQTMSQYDRYRVSAQDWAYLISGTDGNDRQWTQIFADHPEFFRKSQAYEGHYALILRRALPRVYDRKLSHTVTHEEFAAMLPDKKKALSRAPVSEGQLKLLIDTAVSLHKNAVEEARDRRWWIAPLVAGLSVIGSFAGAIAGAYLKHG